ncbi:hypothetical protein MAR_002669 [Mya arenaria]|uniref:Uncharacterized protein n=1 Tax=Mya arenaria TaxID=6604 RepID=A0ABY7G7S9_MYAAR|nr:uncharacterized protein LOC128221249 [Mya arenaria]XP_052785750.1 uncharacterized protein LOC128221249 [Mya arenaria]WAR29101.1 hypothetical protein MAR_002669 [Mya arenaria]
MATTQYTRIPVEEAFSKTWKPATTIISKEELKEAESNEYYRETSDDSVDGSENIRNDLNGNIEIVKRLHPSMPDIRIHSETVETQTNDKVTAKQQSVGFRTPQKLHSEYSQRLQALSADLHKSSSDTFLSEKSDWMLAERSNSRSPPSPALGSRSPRVTASPSIYASTNVFNFSPERTEMYQAELESETRRVKKRLFEEISHGSSDLPQSYLSEISSPSYHHRDTLLSLRQRSSRDLAALESLARDARDAREPETHHYLGSPSFRNKLSSFLNDSESFRAKRRIDLDDEYVSTPKRLKTDLEREMGYRYLHQLESDMCGVRHKLVKQEQEVFKQVHCTCAIMEKQFLEMAESAYRSVRRIDASPRGFEQFRKELIQTNEVMKDSLDVLKNIKSFCEHKR